MNRRRRVVVVRVLDGGKQVLIRQKPSQFPPDGFEIGYALKDLRRPGEGAKKKVAPTGKEADDAPPADEKPSPGGEPLTEAEVLAYLRTNLGDEPFQNPNRAEILKVLVAMIKQRGVAFRYEAATHFNNQAGKYGLISDVTFPLGYNYGPPTQRKWLIGTWNMDKVAAPMDYVKQGDLYRQGELGARMGSLTLNPDGTYAWKLYASDPPSSYKRGSWRQATDAEMRYQGGYGAVLLKAKDGSDWLVRHDRTAPKGEWICISHIIYWQQREFGSRATPPRKVPASRRPR